MTLPHLIFWIVLSAFLLAFGLTIVLSACKAASRNPLCGERESNCACSQDNQEED